MSLPGVINIQNWVKYHININKCDTVAIKLLRLSITMYVQSNVQNYGFVYN